MADFSFEKLSVKADEYKEKLEISLGHFYKEKVGVVARLEEIDRQIERHKGGLELIKEFIESMLLIREADKKELEIRILERQEREKEALEKKRAQSGKK